MPKSNKGNCRNQTPTFRDLSREESKPSGRLCPYTPFLHPSTPMPRTHLYSTSYRSAAFNHHPFGNMGPNTKYRFCQTSDKQFMYRYLMTLLSTSIRMYQPRENQFVEPKQIVLIYNYPTMSAEEGWEKRRGETQTSGGAAGNSSSVPWTVWKIYISLSL